MGMIPKKEIRSGKVRIQLDLQRNQAEMFDALAVECGLETRKELFNVAMTLFNWAVKETRNGRKIASYDPLADEVETVLMPALEYVRPEISSSAVVSPGRVRSVSAAQSGLAVVGKGEPALS